MRLFLVLGILLLLLLVLVILLLLILVLLIGVEEYSQQFFARRTFDLVDLAFSYLGVIFFSWLAIKTKTT